MKKAKSVHSKASIKKKQNRNEKEIPVARLLKDRPVGEIYEEHNQSKSDKKLMQEGEKEPAKTDDSSPEGQKNVNEGTNTIPKVNDAPDERQNPVDNANFNLEAIRKERDEPDIGPNDVPLDLNSAGRSKKELDLEIQLLRDQIKESKKATEELRRQLAEQRMQDTNAINSLVDAKKIAEEKHHDVMKKLSTIGISEIDLIHISAEESRSEKESESKSISGSLFTIRVHRTSEGIRCMIHHPIDCDKQSIRGVDGAAIAAFISRHLAEGPVVRRDNKQLESNSPSGAVVGRKVVAGNSQGEPVYFTIVFKQNKGTMILDKPVEPQKPIHISVLIHLPELAASKGIAEYLSSGSLWLAFINKMTRRTVLHTSKAIKLVPQTPEIRVELMLKGLEPGNYSISCRIIIPLLDKVLNDSFNLTVSRYETA
jgi:hypothetical protein